MIFVHKVCVYDTYVLGDIILCAFRYAIRRKTYVVDEVCNWIRENSHLITRRMAEVMKRDLDDVLKYYINDVDNYVDDIDYITLMNFGVFLEELILNMKNTSL